MMIRAIKDSVVIEVEPDENGWISTKQGLPVIHCNVLVCSSYRGEVFIARRESII